uniref:Uncharacterized protein n=1 Tax=Minutocellus polymorphus TaxID=265543 RepID=A0A7S0FUS2_9STRA
MDEEVGIEVNLTTELDESTKADEHVDVGMNISLSNEGVEIYLDVGNDDAVINEIRSNMQSDDFLRDLSVKLELYMRLEAIYGKAESEEHAQRRLRVVLNRFEGREGVVLLALRRQMDSQAAEEGGQISNDEDIPTGCGDYERAQASVDDNAKESNETTRTKIFKGFVKSIRKTKNISASIEERSGLSSLHGASNIDDGHSSRDDDDLYDADLSADLDEFFNVPVEI